MTALASISGAVGSPVAIDAAGRGATVARSARVADARTITRLINLWSRQGFTIARPLGDVLSSVGDFAVATTDDERIPVACGALESVSRELGEIRSVAVDPAAAGNGAGRAVVAHLVEEAAARGMSEVCLLTRVPSFFERCGFEPVDPRVLPGVFLDTHLRRQGRTHVGRTAMRVGIG